MSRQETSQPEMETDEYYVQKIQDILNQKYRDTAITFSPNKLLEFLYIGGYYDAKDARRLHRLGITHVLNCAAGRSLPQSPYKEDSGIIAYEQFRADDDEDYDILKHFITAQTFIDNCKKQGGKCLVHCVCGVNRSGAICAAYIMADTNMDLLTTIRHMRRRKVCVLYNEGFQKQLVIFARQRGLLIPTAP